jgi:predicted phosphodiesterase
MRLAILSDIHSNLRAWNAVLADIATQRVDRILCLGDLVGYGPSPVEVLESAYRHVHSFVMGNHDAVVAGKMSPDVFNDRAKRLILWTRGRIGRRGIDFLGRLPLTLAGRGYRCGHANFVHPAAFGYILEPEDAAASWAATGEQLLFIGHTHEPRLFVLGHSGTPHTLDPQDFMVEEGKRYIVNVGSVGLPRDADGRATYVLFDEDARAVYYRRVPFDMDAFRADVERAALDPADVPLLRHDPRRRLAPLREAPDFSPATRREDEAQDVVEAASAEVALARRTAAHWRTAAFFGGTVVLALAAVLLLRVRQAAPEPLDTSADEAAAVTLVALAEEGSVPGGKTSLLPPFPDNRSVDGGLFPWGLSLPDAKRASIAPVRSEDGDGGWIRGVTISVEGAPQTVRLVSPPVPIGDGRAPDLLFDAGLRPEADFRGRFRAVLQTRGTPDGDWEGYESIDYAPPGNKKTAPVWTVHRSWSSGHKLKEGIDALRIVLEGDYSGSATVYTPSLTLK